MTAKLLTVVALSVLSVSCGEFTRDGRSPVVVVVDKLTAGENSDGTLLSDVITKGATYNDLGAVEMHFILKDPGTPSSISSPSFLNGVTINRYRVEYRRTDGHNVPGVDVPYAFDSAVTFSIPPGQGASTTFELVRHTAKLEAPLRALAVNGNILSTIATVTFYGRDQAGNDISVSASIGIDFGDFADPA